MTSYSLGPQSWCTSRGVLVVFIYNFLFFLSSTVLSPSTLFSPIVRDLSTFTSFPVYTSYYISMTLVGYTGRPMEQKRRIKKGKLNKNQKWRGLYFTVDQPPHIFPQSFISFFFPQFFFFHLSYANGFLLPISSCRKRQRKYTKKKRGDERNNTLHLDLRKYLGNSTQAKHE